MPETPAQIRFVAVCRGERRAETVHELAYQKHKALVSTFVKALRQSGLNGDDLNNHPVSLAFVSKFNSLCRMTTEREMAAFSTIDKIAEGESVEFEVIPL